MYYSKKKLEENSLYIPEKRGRHKFECAKVCNTCTKECKQGCRVEIILCKKYQAKLTKKS